MVARSFGDGQSGGVYGVGVDLCELSRMKDVLGRWGDRFVSRVFAPAERLSLDSPRAAEHYAARFAAKEAFLKALGTGLRDGIAWTEIVVEREPSGAPRLEVAGVAEEIRRRRGVGRVHLSLTHSRETAAAFVVLERSA